MKKIFILLLFIASYFFFAQKTWAFSPTTFVNFINPIRGEEGWENRQQSPLDLPQFLYQESTPSAFPISWALRFDAINSASISAHFAKLTATDSSQLLAAFLEITPNQAAKAKVVYPAGDYLLQPQRVFLSGYTPADRVKLIDTYMGAFFAKFGHFPATVIAWHIDSYSLQYLADKYSVTSAVIVDDQYSMDHYRVWGSYLGLPYSPSKLNVLVPAENPADKINLVVSKWAARDPFNGLNNSLYSFQVNDYPYVGLQDQYFLNLLQVYSQKDFNQFTQVNIGIENDYSLPAYQQSIKNTYQILENNKESLGLQFASHPGFANWYFAHYPISSPTYTFFTTDPAEKVSGKIFLYQTPRYRIALKQVKDQTQIIDFRIFNPHEAEAFYAIPNQQRTLYLETHPIIDAVKYKDSAKDIDFDLGNAQLTHSNHTAILSSNNQTFEFGPQQIIYPDGSKQKISPVFPLQSKINPLFILLILLPLLFFLRRHKVVAPIIIAVSIIVSLTMIRSGSFTPAGLSFWGPNGHDAFFHLSLISSFRQNFLSLSHPQMTGEVLQNYHIFFDYFAALLGRLSGISGTNLYFRLLPILFSSVILILSYKLTQKLKFNKTSSILALLLVFLTGSLGFVITFFQTGTLFAGESVFWANQSISILLNPPFALSLIFLLAFLLYLNPKLTLKDYLILGILGGLLSQTKVYAFILLCIALLFKKRIKLLLTVGLFGVIFIAPTLKLGGSSPFVFYPLWFPQTMLSSPDRLNFTFLSSALQTYQLQSAWVKIILINAAAVVIFITGNLGIRLLGLYQIIKSRSFSTISIIIFAGIIIPLIFIQNQNPWNTIQFTYYSLFFLSFPTALQIVKVAPKKFLFLIPYSLFLIFLALPTTIGTLADYLTPLPAARVSFSEAWGLEALKNKPQGIVISPVYSTSLSRSLPFPKPLYGYTSTAYISALTNQKEFLSDTINLDITDINYHKRANLITHFYQTQDHIWVKDFLVQNNINYVYELYNQPLQFDTTQAGLNKFFDSGEVNIYRVN